jgi:DNA polymerase
MPTYHPSYLLKNPEMKKAAWADLQMIQKELGRL